MRFFAAILLLVTFPASGLQAGNLGRLFFTPEQRAQLESNYKRNLTATDEQTYALTVNCIVQQHGGSRTVWINGTAQNSAHGRESAAEPVAIPGKSKIIQIKVGEKLLLDTDVPEIPPASAQ